MASLYEANTWRLFLIRGVVAITWAAFFTAVADSLTLRVGALLVLYPLIDVVASLVDAHGQDGPARRLLLAGAATSIVPVALAIAVTVSDATVFAVFGVCCPRWSGAAGDRTPPPGAARPAVADGPRRRRLGGLRPCVPDRRNG
jgi:hypothetical protein